MTSRRRALLVPCVAALIVGGTSAAQSDLVTVVPSVAGGHASVRMTAGRCAVSSATPLAAGTVAFTVRNYSARARRFAIAGRSTRFVRPSRTATLRLTMRAGRFGYSCIAKGRPRKMRRGVLRVHPAPALRVVYSSDWSGTYQLYAVDPSRREQTGQLTFEAAPACRPGNPCGFADPLPSPDGRRIVFSDFIAQGPFTRGLFVANADGSGRLQLASVPDLHVSAAWSPDSRHVAYWNGKGLAIVPAGGGRSVFVAETPRAWRLGWSPDGNWLAYSSTGVRLVRTDGRVQRDVTTDGFPNSFSWSPDGRRLALASDGIKIVERETGAVRMLPARGHVNELAWSPDGRSIAYSSTEGIGVTEVATAATRLLNADSGSSLSWSPDSRLLAYVRTGGGPTYRLYGTTDLRVVDLLGQARTVVSSGESFGGAVTGLAWTRPPVGLSYRRTAGRSLASVSAEELVASGPVTRLATDGGRVAFVVCGHVFLWTPAAGTVEQAEAQASLSPRCDGPTYYDGRRVHSVAIAGERVVFGLIGGGNTTFWWLGGSTMGSATGFMLGEGYATTAGPRTDFVSDAVGSGSLLAFSSVDQQWQSGQCCSIRTIRQELLRVGPSGCPCPVLAAESGPLVPQDVDGGRIVAATDDAVLVLDADGRQLLRVAGKARSAQLAGRDLVIALESELRLYDAVMGELRRTLTVPPDSRLEDVGSGFAAYTVEGRVHVVRLDGDVSDVGEASAARFIDSGLVYVDGARIRLVPFARLLAG